MTVVAGLGPLRRAPPWSVIAVTMQAASSAPRLWAGAGGGCWSLVLPRAALAMAMVGAVGTSARPASDASFLGPCS